VSDYPELYRFLDENPLTLPVVIAYKKPLGILGKSATAIAASQRDTRIKNHTPQ
jgi:hypothetical protein